MATTNEARRWEDRDRRADAPHPTPLDGAGQEVIPGVMVGAMQQLATRWRYCADQSSLSECRVMSSATDTSLVVMLVDHRVDHGVDYGQGLSSTRRAWHGDMTDGLETRHYIV